MSTTCLQMPLRLKNILDEKIHFIHFLSLAEGSVSIQAVTPNNLHQGFAAFDALSRSSFLA